MVKVFNNSNTTFLLTADDGSQKRVPCKTFSDIEDKFKGDITFRMAMAANAFTVFDTAKQGDAAEKKAHSKGNGKNQSTGGESKESSNTSVEGGKGDDAK